MTIHAAAAEAYRRWKGAAAVLLEGKARAVGVIGEVVPDSTERAFTAVGMGHTWEEAFQRADRAPREVRLAALKCMMRARLAAAKAQTT